MKHTLTITTLFTLLSVVAVTLAVSVASAQGLQTKYALVDTADTDCSTVAETEYTHTTKPNAGSKYTCRGIFVSGADTQFSRFPIDGVAGSEKWGEVGVDTCLKGGSKGKLDFPNVVNNIFRFYGGNTGTFCKITRYADQRTGKKFKQYDTYHPFTVTIKDTFSQRTEKTSKTFPLGVAYDTSANILRTTECFRAGKRNYDKTDAADTTKRLSKNLTVYFCKRSVTDGTPKRSVVYELVKRQVLIAPATESKPPLKILLQPELINEAQDGFINLAESAAATSAIIQKPDVSAGTVQYVVRQWAGGITTCTGGTGGGVGGYKDAIPTISKLTKEGKWYICAKVEQSGSVTIYSDVLSVVKDTVAPTIKNTAPATKEMPVGDGVVVSMIVLPLSDFFDGDGVEKYETGTLVGDGIVSPSLASKTHLAITALSEGVVSFPIYAFDSAGNRAEHTMTVTVVAKKAPKVQQSDTPTVEPEENAIKYKVVTSPDTKCEEIPLEEYTDTPPSNPTSDFYCSIYNADDKLLYSGEYPANGITGTDYFFTLAESEITCSAETHPTLDSLAERTLGNFLSSAFREPTVKKINVCKITLYRDSDSVVYDGETKYTTGTLKFDTTSTLIYKGTTSGEEAGTTYTSTALTTIDTKCREILPTEYVVSDPHQAVRGLIDKIKEAGSLSPVVFYCEKVVTENRRGRQTATYRLKSKKFSLTKIKKKEIRKAKRKARGGGGGIPSNRVSPPSLETAFTASPATAQPEPVNTVLSFVEAPVEPPAQEQTSPPTPPAEVEPTPIPTIPLYSSFTEPVGNPFILQFETVDFSSISPQAPTFQP